ncbi:MAG: hypothetical protein LAP38_24605 [Acidobacteriia bacterium]|nr:hypothetical protein [Terriglobia bacterium]
MDIWAVAGYTEATEFERWQRGAGNPIAAEKFRRVLSMTPGDFIQALGAVGRPKPVDLATRLVGCL